MFAGTGPHRVHLGPPAPRDPRCKPPARVGGEEEEGQGEGDPRKEKDEEGGARQGESEVGEEKASRPLVGFGALIDNMIKGLTCLHKIMSRNLIKELVLNKMAHVLQASVFIPLA